MWSTTQIATLDLDGFRALADGRVPALRIPEFATPGECADLSRLLLENSVRTNTIPAVTRLGISQYEQGIRDSKDAYLTQAAELRPTFAEVFSASFDPLSRFVGRLQATGLDVDIMSEPDGRAYWAGSGKIRTGTTPIHVDFAPQDSPGWAVEATVAQLAWILYLRIDAGGDLELWDRRWERELDVHQPSGSYAYEPAVIEGADHLAVRPVVGDVVILNSRYFHAVSHTEHRLAYGSFISVFADGTARLWS